MPKSHFQQYYSYILQIIYVIWEENSYPLTHHTWKMLCTTFKMQNHATISDKAQKSLTPNSGPTVSFLCPQLQTPNRGRALLSLRQMSDAGRITWQKWVSSFLTAHQHILGYLVPYNGENVIKMWRYNQGYLGEGKSRVKVGVPPKFGSVGSEMLSSIFGAEKTCLLRIPPTLTTTRSFLLSDVCQKRLFLKWPGDGMFFFLSGTFYLRLV